MAPPLGVAGVGAAVDAQAQPGPFPQWCPGEFWDPGWGNNWDWNGCHDWRGGPPGYGPRWLGPAWTGWGSRLGPPTTAGASGTRRLRSLPESNTPRRCRRGAFLMPSADSQRRVDLVAEREAARVGVGLGGVEAVRHIRIADPVFQVDEAE